MLKSIRKRGLCILMMACMTGGLFPISGVSAAEAETPEKVCNVLFEEDFEDSDNKISFVAAATNTVSGGTTEANVYGQGQKAYSFTNSTKSRVAYSILNGRTSSEPIAYCRWDKEKTNYTIELSLDWNPRDYNAGSPTTRLSVIGSKTASLDSFEFSEAPIIGVQYTGGDQETSGRKFEITNNGNLVIATFGNDAVIEKLGEGVMDTEHTYRLRFTFKPFTKLKADSAHVKNNGNAGGECTITIDGVDFGTYEYVGATSRDYISAIAQNPTNKENSTDVIDNVKLTETWDALEGASKYINDDALVTAIRNAEVQAKTLTGVEKTEAEAAIAEAKRVYENASVQSQLDAAVKELKLAMSVTEVKNIVFTKDGTISATPIAGSNLTSLTLYTKEDMPDAILIVAVYQGNAQTSPLYRAAIKTVTVNAGEEVIVPFDSTDLKSMPSEAEVKVMLWDREELEPFTSFPTYTCNDFKDHVLDGKKIIFIGNSFTYYGKTVLDAYNDVTEEAILKRFDDKGYFYQMCKQNGADVTITNWTWGGHTLGDTFGGSCDADRGHDGHDHLADLKKYSDMKYDYVVIQPGSNDFAEDVRRDIPGIQEIFLQSNPDVKFIYNVHPRYYLRDQENDKELISAIDEIANELGLEVANWGVIVSDIINGKAIIENATQEYNTNTFIITKSASDGYHPNMLSGYITTQVIYSVITGEKAIGENYSFCTDTTIDDRFSVDTFLNTFYTFDNISPEDSETKLTGDDLTTFPEIFDSASDMAGLQKLIDSYLD